MKVYIVNMERKYVIRRLIILIVLCAAIAITTIGLKELISHCFGTSGNPVNKIDNLQEYPVTLKKGETAWSIQSDLISEKYDVREILYLVEKINERSLGQIKEGETIIFLKEKK